MTSCPKCENNVYSMGITASAGTTGNITSRRLFFFLFLHQRMEASVSLSENQRQMRCHDCVNINLSGFFRYTGGIDVFMWFGHFVFMTGDVQSYVFSDTGVGSQHLA